MQGMVRKPLATVLPAFIQGPVLGNDYSASVGLSRSVRPLRSSSAPLDLGRETDRIKVSTGWRGP
jgi:hypothetical protein